jgi:hypothetical protein
MSRVSRSGFAKREKEKARFEKRQLKLARRQKGKDEEPAAPDETSEGVASDDRPQ